MKSSSQLNLNYLRHTLATLVYRLSKVVSEVPEHYPQFKVSVDSRSPIEILDHINDLIDSAFTASTGKHKSTKAYANNWYRVVSRFYNSIREFDNYLAANNKIACSVERLLQGPIADVLTHIGQLAMLRRLAGKTIKGEDYFDADISIGRVGPEQIMPKREFD